MMLYWYAIKTSNRARSGKVYRYTDIVDQYRCTIESDCNGFLIKFTDEDNAPEINNSTLVLLGQRSLRWIVGSDNI